MRRLSRVATVSLGGSILAYLFFAAAWIHLPGPQYDELLHLPVLSPLLRPDALFSLKFHHHRLPLMLMSYVGALKGWLLWLWFLVVPMGVPGYRAFGVAAGAAAIAMTFWFVHRHYGGPVAALTTVLTATDPSFVHGIRLDYGPVALMHFFKMGGLCLLSRWLASGSPLALAGGMFLFGLGLWDKANFIWFLAGLGATILILFPRDALKRARTSPAAAAVAMAALLAGAAPLIGYNWKRSGETWRERGRFELRWFKLLQAKGAFEGTFMTALTGEDRLDTSPPAHDIAFPGLANWMFRIGRARRTITLPLLALALLLLPLNLWIGGRKRLLFPLLLALLIYVCMFVSLDGGSSVHHVIMVQPFAMLFLAVSLWTPTALRAGSGGRKAGEARPRPVQRAAAAGAVALVMAAVAVNVSVNARQLAIYTRTGGTGGFTDAVYRLVPYLLERPGKKIYAMDWGFSTPIMFLGARWGLKVDDFFYTLNDAQSPGHADWVKKLGELMRDPENVFLLHSPQRTLFPLPAAEFFRLVDGGIPMRQAAYFEERSGEIVYEVYCFGASALPAPARKEIAVQFDPGRVAPGQQYVIRVPEFPNSWIDLVYHVDQVSSGTATRFCHLDGGGSARITVPATHPAAVVRIMFIRPSGGPWLPARGSITVTR